MVVKKIHNRRKLLANRKSLRSQGTSAEAALWTCLKCCRLDGRKFRRQHSIENMIVDFFCPAERLIIELDGEGHFTERAISRDMKRDKRLQALGFKILRFENCLVFTNLESVLDTIKQQFRPN
jgi:very-short-patch-repair endonuclease